MTNQNHESENYKSAIWKPSWYEMDQSLAVGIKSQFRFFQSFESTQSATDHFDFVFYNQLDSDVASEIRFVQIEEIHHEVLGPLNRIDADGLDYVFTTIDGEEIVVNAEEEPGKTYDGDFEVDDWSVVVKMFDVSEPMSDIV